MDSGSKSKITHEVVDSQTGAVIGRFCYSSRNRARALADKKDSAYGAVRYIVRPIFENFPKA